MSLNVLSLFSGIGGLEKGLEQAGMTTVGQVELSLFCRSILARHWPEVPRHDDVTTAPAWWGGEHRPRVDVVCGGFPCQPFSTAGLRRGMDDPRWLWPAMANVIRSVRPNYVLVENVAALLGDVDAFGWLLGDLADLGFDAEWSVLPACALGAPHTRERLFLVAYRQDRDGEGDLSRPVSITDRPASRPEPRGGRGAAGRYGWLPEPSVDRVAHGVPSRLVRPQLFALGNAVVPAVSEFVGRSIVAHHELREVA